MKNLTRTSILTIGATLLVLGLIVWLVGGYGVNVPKAAQAAAAAGAFPPTDNFAVLASTYTNSGATTITGDLGFTTGPGVAPTVSGTTHTADATYDQAGIDQASTLSALNAQSCDFSFGGATDLSLEAQPLVPGVYCITGAASIGTGGITLTGSGTYIFRMSGALTSVANSIVTLSPGVSACDVFWTPGAATTLGANSTFKGTNIDASGIAIGSTVSWTGRALAFGGTITSDADTIAAPTCTPAPATLNVIKHVVNDDAGVSTASAWTLTLSSSNGGSGTGSAVGSESPGTAYTLQAGKAYSVAESGGPAGYGASASSDCTIANAVSGATYTCTITNDDIPPAAATLHIIKSVINVSGTAVPSDFLVHVKSATSTLDVAGSPFAGVATPGTLYTLAAGAYIVTEAAHPSFPTYTQTFGLDCVGGTFTLAAGEDKICTVINTDIPPPAPVAASSGGGAGSGPGPLIKVTKVPTPLALPSGPGPVAYIYTVTNIGPVPMIGVWVKDDTCAQVTFVSGDTDGDSKLDLAEAWVYRCIQTVSQTVTNTATARGSANSQEAYDTALATVVVGPVPGLPDTGILPPLINIVKVPSRLTPFPFGGGNVTYTYTVTNPGVVAMHDVSVTDDKCASISRISGDTNSDNLLDTGESWTYTCRTHISASTRNTATAEGRANGFIALDYAFATVLVGSPGFPNTGLPPQGNDSP